MSEENDTPSSSPSIGAAQAARRRRTAVIVIVAAVVVAAVGVTLTVTSLRSASKDAAGSSSTSANSAASPTQPTPTTTAPPSGAVPTQIPVGFTLPDEGQPGWSTADGTLNFCTGVTVPLAGVAQQRVIKTAPVAENTQFEGIYVFATADAAGGFAAAAEQLAAGCVATPPAGESSAVTPLQGSWDSAFVWYNAFSDGAPGGNYVLLARKGSAVMVSGGYGEWPTAPAAPDATALAMYQPPLEAIAAKACVFTNAGC